MEFSRSPDFITPLIDEQNSRFWVVPNFTRDLYPTLKRQLSAVEEKVYVEPPIKVFGKEGRQRRNILFLSDESIGYHYSGQLMPSDPLDTVPVVKVLLRKVNEYFGTSFNGVLINIYIDGTKHIGAHSDDETALDPDTNLVLGIAYGATRKFRLRRKKGNKVVHHSPEHALECGVEISSDGDYLHRSCELLAMEGDFQKHFKHEVPIEKSVTEERISLTFRRHLE